MGDHILNSVHILALLASCQKALFIFGRAATILSLISNETQSWLRLPLGRTHQAKKEFR